MEIKEKLKKINFLISKESWLDMEILEIKGGNLVIACSTDFSYGHCLEIKFIDVFHVNINAEWKTDTSKAVLHMANDEECLAVNQNYQIEQGNILFKITAEDLQVPFYISAKNLDYNTDSVLYYKKENLKDNERIADWVQ